MPRGLVSGVIIGFVKAPASSMSALMTAAVDKSKPQGQNALLAVGGEWNCGIAELLQRAKYAFAIEAYLN
jgi:hypothetical protein